MLRRATQGVPASVRLDETSYIAPTQAELAELALLPSVLLDARFVLLPFFGSRAFHVSSRARVVGNRPLLFINGTAVL